MPNSNRKFKLIAAVTLSLLALSFLLPGSGVTSAAYNLIENAGTALTQRPTLNFVSGTTCVDNAGSNRTDCTTSGSGPTANQNIRSFGSAFNGGGAAITVGSVTYVTIPFACTIAGYNITVDTGTVSFDVWKVATGTAIPTVSNTILTGGYLALSSGTALHSSSVTLFTTTAVSANDIVGVSVHAVSSATNVSLVIQCNAT